MTVGAAILIVAGQTLGPAPMARAADEKPAWVFYGMLLKPAEKGAAPQWEPDGPNFSIVKAGKGDAGLPTKGALVKCVRTMTLRDSCLALGSGADPGAYQWGKPTGKKVEPGAQVAILEVKALSSPRGKYYWVEVGPAS